MKEKVKVKLIAKSFKFEDSDGITHRPWIDLEDAIEILSELYAQPEIDINTPFFGNSGVKILMEQEKEEMRILESVKQSFDYYSDGSAFCLGYKNLCDRIKDLKSKTKP